MLERHFAGNAESRAAGMVINTMGWIEGIGYEVIGFGAYVVMGQSTFISECSYRYLRLGTVV